MLFGDIENLDILLWLLIEVIRSVGFEIVAGSIDEAWVIAIDARWLLKTFIKNNLFILEVMPTHTFHRNIIILYNRIGLLSCIMILLIFVWDFKAVAIFGQFN